MHVHTKCKAIRHDYLIPVDRHIVWVACLYFVKAQLILHLFKNCVNGFDTELRVFVTLFFGPCHTFSPLYCVGFIILMPRLLIAIIKIMKIVSEIIRLVWTFKCLLVSGDVFASEYYRILSILLYVCGRNKANQNQTVPNSSLI